MVKGNNRILLLDLETAPSLGYFWEMWETNIIEVTKHGYLLSASLKWLDEKQVHFYGLCDYKDKKDSTSDKKLLEKIIEVVNQADIIIAHNGDRFDLTTLNTRLVANGMKPIHQARTIDTLKVARNKFRFISNKLDDLGNFLGVGRKTAHTGKHLWFGCMNGDKKSWELMKKYNNQDVLLLEQVYLKLRPFMTNHPNLNILNGTKMSCPNCSADNMIKSKLRLTTSGYKQQYQCRKCGRYATGSKAVKVAELI